MRDEVYAVGDVVTDCPPPPMMIRCDKHPNNPYSLEVYPIMKNHVWTGEVVGLNKNHKWAHEYVKYLVNEMLTENRAQIEDIKKITQVEYKLGELGRFVGDLCEEIESLKERFFEQETKK